MLMRTLARAPVLREILREIRLANMASSLRWEEAREKLKRLREDQSRCSEEVLELWEEIGEFSYKVGDEIWLIYEQVCIAACDCGRPDIAKKCIDALRHQFSDSLRVQKLDAIWRETLGRYDDALKIYETILETDQTNSLVRKRLVALHKAQNHIPEAIKELNDYLTLFMSDYDGWLELCDMYLMEMDYKKACFCMEELIMSNPHNHLYHQKYAEIKYTQQEFKEARSYFAQALKTNPNNMRALYGLFMSARNLAARAGSHAKEKKENLKYAAWASGQIAQRYKGKMAETSQVQTIEYMLDNLQLTSSTS